ncbi:DUF1972 domain-containing protein [Pseudomonas sp. RW10S2]|uniref:DUF1972 domain-containing protein n=1 Tax=Pseudomonas sp. RW10S2 TaxID=459637 RepID=UPI0016451398|nr:DUF1972 domain-containing protein [Pseudomonas sp. RW10S2]MBC3465566.1 DUF1972 domain-containing protein [Pseudomonas sp. RW10S2]QXI44672.1 DUF1972 domain-containing protein [Pseudomonas wayambapalatensis]
MRRQLSILGIRGIPAGHGGFETFAEKLSLYLVSKEWDVVVYCQEEGEGAVTESAWNGIRLVHIPVKQTGALGTIVFDWRATCLALKSTGLFLTLGYNTALFNVLQRLKGQVNVINMDGIEWKRKKWGRIAKTWFWINERIGCLTGNYLVADHPRIRAHLATRVSAAKISMIPYGAEQVLDADASALEAFSLAPQAFSVVIARPEPENSFLEIVRAFSLRPRQHTLVVLGKFDVDRNAYHRAIVAAASNEVIFPGAIYDSRKINALRFYSRFYIHGHQVGGTNPSLVEALGAGCAVIAHDNPFNQWVAGAAARYFADERQCAQLFDQILTDDSILQPMKTCSQERFEQQFTWPRIFSEYEALLTKAYENV